MDRNVQPVGLIDPSFCCCAIPLVNSGIIAILCEQAVLGIGVTVSLLATPSLVAAVVPKFASIILAVVCLCVTVIQPVGFIGVLREKTSTFKAYAWVNGMATLAAFITAAALIGVSGARHNSAVASCQTNFFTPSNSSSLGDLGSTTNTTLTDEGNKLCSPFVWADLGLMGGLWVLLLLIQLYFIFYIYNYSRTQVKDHKLYHSVYSENPEAFTMSILRSSRYNPGSVYNTNPGPMVDSDVWDSRASMDSPAGVQGENYYDRPPPGVAGYGYDPEERLSNYSEAPGGYGEGQAGFGGYGVRGDYDQGSSGSRGGYDHQQGPLEPTFTPPPPEGGGFPHPNPTGPPQGGYDFSSPAGYPSGGEEGGGYDPNLTPTMNRYSQGQGVGYAAGGSMNR